MTERQRDRERKRQSERGRIRKKKKEIATQQLEPLSLDKTFFGHVMRREKPEHLVTSGMIVGKQRQKLLNGLTK